MSKFRTLKLYLIRKSNFKKVLSYDIIVPKANKAEEFAPLIEIAERELENFEEEDGNGLSEEEFKQFVQEVYQQTLNDIISENNPNEEEEPVKNSEEGQLLSDKISNGVFSKSSQRSTRTPSQ